MKPTYPNFSNDERQRMVEHVVANAARYDVRDAIEAYVMAEMPLAEKAGIIVRTGEKVMTSGGLEDVFKPVKLN